MISGELFPLESEWVEEVAFRIATGSKLKLAAPPATGKRLLARSLLNELTLLADDGELVIHIDGAVEDHKSILHALDRCDAAARRGQPVWLIFEAFGHAIRKAGAKRVQARMFYTLINSPHVRDVGCLITHRLADRTDLNISASTFMNRIETVHLPVLTPGRSDVLGSLAGAVDWTGPMPQLVRSSLFEGAFDKPTWNAYWRSVCHKIVRDLPSDYLAAVVTDSRRNFRSVDRLFAASTSSPIPSQIAATMRTYAEIFRGPWPIKRRAAARRFARLLDWIGPGYWCDKYALDPGVRNELLEFLQFVRADTSVELNILSCVRGDWDRDVVRKTFADINQLEGVKVRVMPFRDDHRLHDRHLISAADGSGFTLPECRDLIAKKQNATSAESELAQSPVDYSILWRSADRTI